MTGVTSQSLVFPKGWSSDHLTAGIFHHLLELAGDFIFEHAVGQGDFFPCLVELETAVFGAGGECERGGAGLGNFDHQLRAFGFEADKIPQFAAVEAFLYFVTDLLYR